MYDIFSFHLKSDIMKRRMKPILKSLSICGLLCCFALTLNAQSTYSLEQLQQIRMTNDSPELPAQASGTLKSSAVCDNIIYDYNDPVICSVQPNPGGNIDIVVGFNDCNFAPEIDNGDGTLTVEGLSLFIDPNGANIFLGTVLESATNGTSACSTTPLMVPANMTCDPIMAEFGASVTTFIVDVSTGVITDFTPNPDCDLETFIVTINPNLGVQIDDDTDNCGTITAQLVAEDGTLCGEPVTATCTEDSADLILNLGETYDCANNMLTATCNCEEEPPAPEVPTVGEWGLMILGLMMLIAAVVGIRERKMQEVYEK